MEEGNIKKFELNNYGGQVNITSGDGCIEAVQNNADERIVPQDKADILII